MKQLVPALFLLAFLQKTMAQDLHFSQAPLAPFQQNPALAGVFEGDYRAGANYRSQWKSVPVPYQTVSFYADGKLADLGGAIVGGGLKFDSDRAGDAAISWANATLFGSVSRVLGQNSAVSLGIALGGGQRAFDISKLRFGKQFLDQYSPTLPNGENFSRSSGLVPEVGAGLNWHWQQSRLRSHFDLGVGGFHLNGPSVSFRDDKKSRLATRFNLNCDGVTQLGALRDLLISTNVQNQGSYTELLFSVGIRRWLEPGQTAFSFLVGARLGDALIPQARLEWGNWLVGASYDWNFSGLSNATLGHGGPELAIQWRFVKGPPVKVFKVCPIY